MFIELIDHLRCVRPHEESWLVAAARRMDGRQIVDGTLGCPVCRAEYPIRDGAADFRSEAARDRGDRSAPPSPPDEGEVMRAGALLGLVEAGGVALLAGEWGDLAEAIAELVDVQLLLLDPAPSVRSAERISVVRADAGAAPFTAGFLRAAAVDGRSAAGERLSAVSRALRPGGRLLAPADAPLPADIAELARDERHWVGERRAGVSRPVQLETANPRRRPR